MAPTQKLWPAAGLLSGAITWGLIWYPARLVESAGIGGALMTLITYLTPLGLGALLFAKYFKAFTASPWLLLLIALSSGWANLGYVLGVIHGEVMRVLLLFYLAPVWTVVFARFILGEKLSLAGYAIIATSLAGALLILWQSQYVFPLPQNAAEWWGLTAGMMFALTNVLARLVQATHIYAKSLAVWAGVSVVALTFLMVQGQSFQPLVEASGTTWLLLIGLALLMFVVTIAVQFGLAHLPANQAIIIFLSELVVGAVSSYYLAGEALSLREWVGGAMILLATLFSGKLNRV